MDPNVLSAVVGGVAGLGGAMIGGGLAAWATIKATKRANEHSLRLQIQAQEAAIQGVLLGLRAEISTLWETYSKEFGPIIEELQEGEEFDYIYPLFQHYFSVYESNASLFGQIPDDRLRKAIVTTYLKGRGLIDTHLYNNQLIERHRTLRRLRDETGNANLDPQINAALENLKGYSKSVRDNYFEMRALVTDLTNQIDNHVASLKVHVPITNY